MAHKCMIDGTSYNITGGKACIDGTSRKITGGKTLINGTAYNINFESKPTVRDLFASAVESNSAHRNSSSSTTVKLTGTKGKYYLGFKGNAFEISYFNGSNLESLFSVNSTVLTYLLGSVGTNAYSALISEVDFVGFELDAVKEILSNVTSPGSSGRNSKTQGTVSLSKSYAQKGDLLLARYSNYWSAGEVDADKNLTLVKHNLGLNRNQATTDDNTYYYMSSNGTSNSSAYGGTLVLLREG